MYFWEWINPLVIATFVLAIATGFMVLIAFRSIRENRRMRAEDRELDSKRRRLDEVQHWINEVLRLKSESVIRTDDPGELARRKVQAKIISSTKEYIETESQRLDSEFMLKTKLKDQIGRLSFILEREDLSADGIQHELEEKCSDVLKTVSNIKAKLKL
jgi:hypothetical protein